MPTRNYRDDQLKRLSDIEYAAQYLSTALDESLTGKDNEVFVLALQNVVDASDINISNQDTRSLLNSNLTLENTVSILNALSLTIDIKPLGSHV